MSKLGEKLLEKVTLPQSKKKMLSDESLFWRKKIYPISE